MGERWEKPLSGPCASEATFVFCGCAGAGVLLAIETPYPKSGLFVLMLRSSDGAEMEVLVDAESTLQHLAATFGSADAAVGQEIKLELDVFGFPSQESPESS